MLRSPWKASCGLTGWKKQGEDRDGHDDHRNHGRQNESRGQGDHECTYDIDEQETAFPQEVAGECLVPGCPALLLWRPPKAKRAEGDPHEEDQHRYKGA